MNSKKRERERAEEWGEENRNIHPLKWPESGVVMHGIKRDGDLIEGNETVKKRRDDKCDVSLTA